MDIYISKQTPFAIVYQRNNFINIINILFSTKFPLFKGRVGEGLKTVQNELAGYWCLNKLIVCLLLGINGLYED